jgi:hypothetical protein
MMTSYLIDQPLEFSKHKKALIISFERDLIFS